MKIHRSAVSGISIYNALSNRLTRTDSPSVPPPPVLNGTVTRGYRDADAN